MLCCGTKLKWEEENNLKGVSWCQVGMEDKEEMNLCSCFGRSDLHSRQHHWGDWQGLLACLEQLGNLCESEQKDLQAEVREEVSKMAFLSGC